MADDFKGSNHIDLEPGDANVPVKFKFKAASASTANDGAIPYGSTLASSTVHAHLHSDTGIAVSTQLVTSRALSSNSVVAYLTHTTTIVDGLYDLTMVNTYSLSGSTLVMTRQHDFDRVFVRNR